MEAFSEKLTGAAMTHIAENFHLSHLPEPELRRLACAHLDWLVRLMWAAGADSEDILSLFGRDLGSAPDRYYEDVLREVRLHCLAGSLLTSGQVRLPEDCLALFRAHARESLARKGDCSEGFRTSFLDSYLRSGCYAYLLSALRLAAASGMEPTNAEQAQAALDTLQGGSIPLPD